jgi:peroxiredoxin
MNRHASMTMGGRFALWVAVAAAGTILGCSAKPRSEAPPSERAADDPQPAAEAPRPHTAFYHSAGEKAGEPATIPPVLLTDAHKSLCLVGVGDPLPEMELQQLGGRRSKLADLYGKKATVVVFWKSDRRMTLTELADLGPDVVEPFQGEGVAVVGVAVGESANQARSIVRQTGAKFPNLLDTDGAAFAKVGSDKLPRTYLLDPSGKILWFDIEYSQSTRRELAQSLEAVAGRK